MSDIVVDGTCACCGRPGLITASYRTCSFCDERCPWDGLGPCDMPVAIEAGVDQ